MSGDLLGALLNAAGSQSGSSQSSGDPLSALLTGLMGGSGAQQGAQGGDVLGSLLGGLMGGGGAQGTQDAGDLGSLMGGGGAQGVQDSNVLGSLLGGSGAQGAQGGDVLGGLMGGSAQGTQSSDVLGSLLGGGAPSAQQGAGDLGSLMGSGGAQGTQGGDVLGSLLGGLLGGGVPQGGQQMPTASAGITSNSFLAPIVHGLAQKLGLPPAIAETVVSFALTQLLNSLMNRASTGREMGMQSFDSSQRALQVAGDLQTEDISQRFQSGLALDADYLHSAGLPQQLADQTGLDPKTAAASLEQAFQLLGAAPGSDPEQAIKEETPRKQQKVSRRRKK